MKKQILSVFVAFFLLVFFIPKVLLAAPFYEGKIMTLIVGASIGTGYDRVARILARYLPKHIPGNPTIVCQNIAGGGNIIGPNHLYNLAKPDGLTIGVINRSLVLGQLLKMGEIKFDMSKFSWIGSTGSESTVFVVRSTLPFKTIDDLRKVEDRFHMANTGRLLVGSQFVPILMELLGSKLKFITYPGGGDVVLALERKEVDCFGATYSTLKPHIDRGVLRPLMRGPKSEPEIANLPVNEDLAKDNKTKTIVSVLSAPDTIGRPFLVPPKTPSDKTQILRGAFMKTIKDAEFQAEAQKSNLEAEYMSGEEVQKIINFVLSQPSDIVKEISKY